MIIRKALPTDSEFVANYMLLAMEDIVYKFIGEHDDKKAQEFMFYFVSQPDNQYSYQNCWVAEIDANVVAAVNVYDGAEMRKLREPVLEYIKSRYNEHINIQDETEAGEFYIDTLAVSPELRGKTIGSKILQFLIEEYVTKRNEILGLLVDEENPDAKRLYLRLGFKTIGKKFLFDKNMEHLQIKASNQ